MQDASAKVLLLQSEIEFNDALITVLGQIQGLDNKFGDVKESFAQDNFLEAISTLDEIQKSITGPSPLSRSHAITILQKRASDTHEYIAEDLQRIWRSLVTVNRTERSVRIVSRNDASSMSPRYFILVRQ